jgi:MFS family permease
MSLRALPIGRPLWTGLTACVVACGVWSVWLIRPTFHAASFAFTTALTVLLVAVLQVRYGRPRAFWFGFVVFGWGYALLAFAPGAWEQTRPYLLTSHPLGDLADSLGLTKTSPNIVAGTLPNVILAAGLNPWFATVEGDRFQRIGHSLAAILHGVAGGVLAAWLGNRARNREDERDGGVR